jgi:hypothetical protein
VKTIQSTKLLTVGFLIRYCNFYSLRVRYSYIFYRTIVQKNKTVVYRSKHTKNNTISRGGSGSPGRAERVLRALLR